MYESLCYNSTVVTIEHLKEEDILKIVELEKLSFSAPKEEAVFKSDQNKYLVAKEGGSIVGYIGVEKISGETHIINTAVHPEYRRKGIGKKLIEKILNDKDVFFLEVRVSNVPALELYGKYRFKNVGTRKKYYADNDEDAYIMRREPQ
jgi:ribosomal-protein-alanine N-acetyltransferase